MKLKPRDCWAIIDAKGLIVRALGSRNKAREYMDAYRDGEYFFEKGSVAPYTIVKAQIVGRK